MDTSSAGSSVPCGEDASTPRTTVTVQAALSGEELASVHVGKSITIADLKGDLETKLGMPAPSFSLVLGGRKLHPMESLCRTDLQDGPALVLIQNPPYIHTEPSGEEFLAFPGGDLQNFSSSWGWKGGVKAKTYFSKVLFDRETMRIFTGNFRFARVEVEEEGSNRGEPGPDGLLQGNPGKWTPYATCLDCSAPHSNKALARIDLRGTPYRIPEDEFAHSGWLSNGTWTYSENGQVVDISGGGFCGWAAPKEVCDMGLVDEGAGGWLHVVELDSGTSGTAP